jgi:hypothetical protein
MTSIHKALVELFLEVFEGTPAGAGGTWFVQGNEALDATLAGLSAQEASRTAIPGASSIAAHVIHTAYYLELANDHFRGRDRDGDWAGSWKRQTVTEAEWTAAKANLTNQRNDFLSQIQQADLAVEQEDLTYALANLGHVAYHLGGIRQLFLAIKASR